MNQMWFVPGWLKNQTELQKVIGWVFENSLDRLSRKSGNNQWTGIFISRNHPEYSTESDNVKNMKNVKKHEIWNDIVQYTFYRSSTLWKK